MADQKTAFPAKALTYVDCNHRLGTFHLSRFLLDIDLFAIISYEGYGNASLRIGRKGLLLPFLVHSDMRTIDLQRDRPVPTKGVDVTLLKP
jgi:hypothetical protein